jgi:glycerate 2-kinase
MRIVIAPDSFKESLSAEEACAAMAEGVRRALPEAVIESVPMADGGEGTVDALVAATGGRVVRADATGPLGESVIAAYGVLGDGETAVIEMAAASGLALVPVKRRDARVTTTRGTGELMVHEMDAGLTRLIIGLGGSATNDGGAGMAQALGYGLRDDDGNELVPGGTALAQLATIDTTNRHSRLDACDVRVACDVTNPLCGPNGASHVYGPQKGADTGAARELDAALAHFAAIVEKQLGVSVKDVPGAGAAGGLGAGLIAFAGGTLQPGFEIVAEATNLRERMAGADLVLTGEGRLDGQSVQGKTPVGVARMAKSMGIPAIALAGSLGDGYEAVLDEGITAALAIAPADMPLDEALATGAKLLANATNRAVEAYLTRRK